MGIDNVQDLAPRNQYVALASQSVFDYTFPIFADGDLVVALDAANPTILVLTTDYTVSGATNETGGQVTLVVPLAAGRVITIYRDLPAERNTDVPQNGPWNSAEYNDELDKVIMLIQQLQMRLDRVVRFSLTSTITNADLEVTDASELTGMLTTLDSLSDVSVSSPQNQYILSFDASANQWIARAQGDIAATTIADNAVELRGATFTAGTSIIVPANMNDVPIYIKQECNISKIILLTRGGSGSCVVDIWKKPIGAFPPTVADSIMGPSKPTIVAGTTYQDTTLTGVNKFLSGGDTLVVHLESSTAFTVVGVFIQLTPLEVLPLDEATDERIAAIVHDILAEGGGNVIVSGSTYTVTFTGNAQNIKLWEVLGRPAGVVTVNFTLPEGVILSASSTRDFGLDFSGFQSGSTINWTNHGRVLGVGGEGGDGAEIIVSGGGDNDDLYFGSYRLGGRGQPGGPAVRGPGAGISWNIDNGDGFIFGGGGGGPGGGASATRGPQASNGGGGGGGAGGGKRGRGGRAAGGVGGSQLGTGGTQANDGLDGTTGANGTFGTGGTGAGVNGGVSTGTGGNGGDWGSAASAGVSPVTGSFDAAAGATGAGGNAIDLNGGSAPTWLAGNDATHVKGAVS